MSDRETTSCQNCGVGLDPEDIEDIYLDPYCAACIQKQVEEDEGVAE